MLEYDFFNCLFLIIYRFYDNSVPSCFSFFFFFQPVFSQTYFLKLKHSHPRLHTSRSQVLLITSNVFLTYRMYSLNLLDGRWMNMYENMKDAFVQQPRVSEPGSVSERKWKLAKERAAHISFPSTFCTMEYVFYICEKNWWEISVCHLQYKCWVHHITGPSSYRFFSLVSKWTENCALKKQIIDDLHITASVAGPVRVAITIYTIFLPSNRK